MAGNIVLSRNKSLMTCSDMVPTDNGPDYWCFCDYTQSITCEQDYELCQSVLYGIFTDFEVYFSHEADCTVWLDWAKFSKELLWWRLEQASFETDCTGSSPWFHQDPGVSCVVVDPYPPGGPDRLSYWQVSVKVHKSIPNYYATATVRFRRPKIVGELCPPLGAYQFYDWFGYGIGYIIEPHLIGIPSCSLQYYPE